MCISINESLGQNKRKKRKKDFEPSLFVTYINSFENNTLSIKKDYKWNLFYANENLLAPKNSFNNSLGIGVRLNNKFDIVTQFNFQNFCWEQSKFFDITYCDPTFYNATKIDTSYRQIFIKSINFPIEVRYKIVRYNKITLLLTLGLSTHFMYDKRQDVVMKLDNGVVAYHENNKHSLEINNKINFAPYSTIGFRYQLLKPLYLKTAFHYSFFLKKEQVLSETNNSNIQTYGLQLGIEYKLR